MDKSTQITEKNQLSDIGYKIFLDRYALKDGVKESLAIGDLVIVCVDTKTGQREIGECIEETFGDKGRVFKIRLANGETIERHIDNIDKPMETDISQLFDRVAKGAAKVEASLELQNHWEKRFRASLEGFGFLPAGRILAGCGTDQKLTYQNCFVLPCPKDSRQGIINTCGDMMELYARGGGVGINVSSLRPKYSYVKGVNGRSSGAVSWASLYSFVGGKSEQGGSRRAALMLILGVWHPDVEDFINAKRVAGEITNANISVAVTDDFMDAVRNNSNWNLEFPITEHPAYDKEWDGDIYSWKAKGYPVKLYRTVKAAELWDLLISSAHASAEPGTWLIDKNNKMSNSYYYPEGKIICCNPCAEQGLPAWGICNLGHINLSTIFIKDSSKKLKSWSEKIDWGKLDELITVGVRFLDNIIDATPYFFAENEKQQKLERRIGMGTLGLGELLINLNVKYGSPESLHIIDELFRYIAEQAYMASCDIAEEKGAFPAFDADKFLNSGFTLKLSDDTRDNIKKKGIRNVTLTTQAPTGTVGTMVDTSTGIEPYYFWEYSRTTRLGSFMQRVRPYREWASAYYRGDIPDKVISKDLPNCFVTAMDLSPEDHVKVMAAIQNWTCSSCSKTVNCPESYTVEQIKKVYDLMYDLGCKGISVYRDKSRDEQVLNLVNDKKEEKSTPQAAKPIMSPKPNKRTGVTISKKTHLGTLHITMNNDENGNPFEVFLDIGKGGSDLKAFAEGLGRSLSLSLRLTSGVPAIDRVKEIISQLEGIGGSDSFGFGPNKIKSIPDAVASALRDNYFPSDAKAHENGNGNGKKNINNVASADLCSKCGNCSVIKEEGCSRCLDCGASKCG